MPLAILRWALLVPLLTGCTAGAPSGASAPPAAPAPNEPPPKIRAWMDRLTVPHDYDPKTGFIVARATTPLPPVIASAPPLDQAIADAGSIRTVIVFVTADRCAPCQQYKLDAIGNPDVVARLSEPRFLPTHLEVDRSPQLAERYLGTQSIPMTYALRDGTVIAQLPGQRSAADLLAWIDGLPQ
ncbi:MAG: thioredoxin family protein [Phycisphaerales bacterium]|nr:thioredoxin family protein [Phycisphaerales bacterium]